MAAKSDYENIEKWITVNGTHVKVEKGKTIGEAIERRFGAAEPTPTSTNTNNVLTHLLKSNSSMAPVVQEKTEHSQKKLDEKHFREQLQQVADGTFNKESHLLLGDTPNSLVELAGLPQLPLMMPYNKAYLNINKSGMIEGNYHDLGIDVLSQLPNSLCSPKYIFKHDNPKRVEIVVELKDKKGNNIFTSVELDTVGVIDGKRANANIVITAFAPKSKNYINSRIAAGKIIYKK